MSDLQNSNDRWALVLAGGRGERLRPLTDRVPKPMVEVGGHPILWHQVERLRETGVTDVVFLVGYLGSVVEEFFGDGREFGIRAHYHHEEIPLGRGGALKQGLALVGDQGKPVLAANGDVFTDADLNFLWADYDKRRGSNPRHLVTVLAVPMVSPYGIVDADGTGLVRGFREKVALPYRINGGVYVMDPAIRDLLPDVGDHETSTFPEAAEAGRMSAVLTGDFWRSVDSPKDLREVDEHLQSHWQMGMRSPRLPRSD